MDEAQTKARDDFIALLNADNPELLRLAREQAAKDARAMLAATLERLAYDLRGCTDPGEVTHRLEREAATLRMAG